MRVSLIISTYNWPRALELCLDSVMQQRVLPSEILVADDGSGSETRHVIEQFEKISPVPLYHVWQEDRGFRLAAIRNKAIAAAHCEYIIQIDGDLILHRDFISDHIMLAQRGSFAAGSRCMVSNLLTRRLIDNKKRNGSISFLSRGIDNRLNGIRLPLLSWMITSINKRVRGCNMAFWRDDLIRINGYNEAFEGWGCEDSELAVRLCNAGIKERSIKFRGIAYHLYHPNADRSARERNQPIVERAMAEKTQRCKRGLDQYVIEPTSYMYPLAQKPILQEIAR